MNTLPLITIGITCFNAEDTIARAITSAAKQDWPNFEIVVVDDASSDKSVDVIKELQKKDSRIQLQQHDQNLGYPSALNTIVQNARGDYIAFFDDDDDNAENRLDEQYIRLTGFQAKHSDTPVLCYSHRRVFVDGKEKPEGFVHAIGAKAPEPHGEMAAKFLLWHEKEEGYQWGEFGSCTMMAPTSTLKEFQFDPNFRRSAEWDLVIRVALKGGHFIAVDKPLITQHKTQTMDKAGTKPLQYSLLLRKKHKDYLKKNKVYLGSILQAYSRFHYFRNNRWLSRFYLTLACLCSPTKILTMQLKRLRK
jgi:glycosyltransferase involved in cell wall biosynthesis